MTGASTHSDTTRGRLTTLVAFVEGSSDLSFFPDVLGTLLRAVLGARPGQAEVVVEELHSGSTGRGQWVVDRVARHHQQASVVAVHVDGSAKPDRELQNGYAPIEEVWTRSADTGASLVALVPVREMEAWALSDLDVLRGVVGVDWDPSSVFEADSLTRPEKLTDPKRTLDTIVAQARRPRRRPRSIDAVLPFVAERLELPALRRLPSFQQFEADLRAALLPASETTP